MGNLFAERIGGSAFARQNGYKMEAIKVAKRRAQVQYPGRFFLDMGIGEPDRMPPLAVIEELQNQAVLPMNRGYADNGCLAFKEAAAAFMASTFGVTLDPQKEVIHCIGAKSALSMLPSCFINPGDLVLSTTPCYPIFDTHVRYLGGEVVALPLLRKNDYLPDLTEVPVEVAKRAKVFNLNYPNNPTSAPATRKFYEELIEFARTYDLFLVNDAVYGALVKKEPLSLLGIDGAKERSVEVHSLSKTYNMTGWRIGWVCGNARVIEAFSGVKNNSDSGQFLAIQRAAIKALRDKEFPKRMVRRYHRRKRLIGEVLRGHGFEVYESGAGFFLYVKLPRVIRYGEREIAFKDAEGFAGWLLEELGIIGVGWKEPEGGIRLSMTYTSRTEGWFIEEFRNRLNGLTAVY